MFSLEEIKEYWCIVAVNDDKDDARIMRVSEDITKDEALTFCNGTHMDDTSIDCEWFENWIDQETTVPGVHKLTLEAVYEVVEDDTKDSTEPTAEEKNFDYFKVVSTEVLFTL